MFAYVCYIYRVFYVICACRIVLLSAASSQNTRHHMLIPEALRNDINRRGDAEALMRAIDMADVSAVRTLIIQGCDAHTINFYSPLAWGPIIQAAACRAVPIMYLLLSNGGNPNSTDGDNWSALMYAASRGSADVVDVLLRYGANVNIADNDGWTALHAAVFTKRLHIIRLLVEAGIELDAEHDENGTALEYACVCGRYDTIPQLVRYGACLPKESVTTRMHRVGQDILSESRRCYQNFLLDQLCKMHPKLSGALCCLLLEFVNGDRCESKAPCSEFIPNEGDV